jgi:hypothetical protein
MTFYTDYVISSMVEPMKRYFRAFLRVIYKMMFGEMVFYQKVNTREVNYRTNKSNTKKVFAKKSFTKKSACQMSIVPFGHLMF